ncbi:MAG: hypothetical protein J6W29_03750, partial [Neisseriaceae bacterium]|nr:hypothetical protein [Neisseriaceae bacterium]
MKKTAANSLISRKNSQHKTFALSVLSASLILANTAVYAADESPFSRAPLHLLNPGQTEIRTQTITHTEGVSDYKVTTPYTTTTPNVKPNIMLYVDNSGSMLGNQGAASVLEFAQDGGLLSQYASMANWGLTWMNGKDTQHSWEYDFPSPTYFPNVSVSADQKRVRDAIAFMGTVDGITRMNNYATPMIGGYITAAENLTKSMNDNNRCAKNYLIAMTDGAANGGPQRGASGLGAYYKWYGPYTTGFIPINAILNQTQYVKKFFPTYPVDKRSPQYQFLCPRDQNDVNKGTGFCADKYGLSEFVLYPYTGHAQAHWYYTAASDGGESMRSDGWRYIRNNADRGQWGDITQFPNNSDYSRAYWYSSTGLTGSAGTAYIAFTDASSSKDAPDMMRWLSKEWDSKDLRPDIKGKQTFTTFTIGFGSDFGDNQKGQPHYELLKNGASDKPSGGKWFATAMDADGLKSTFKQIFDYIKQETEDQNNSFPPPQPFSSTSDGGTAQSSSTSGGTIKRQSYSTSTPGKVGSGLTTGYPDAMASLQLNEKLTGTELIFTKLNEFGKPVGDDEKGSYIGAKFNERRAMISKGDGTAKWFDTPNGWYNTDFGLKNNTNEYKDTLLPWIARYGTDSDIQTRAKTHNDYEVNPYRIRVATKEHDMGDVLDTGIVSIGNRTAEVGRTDPADNTGRKEFLLTAANDGLVYIFQNQKTANIADTPPYSLKLNYSPATMPRSTTTDTVASKFSKIAREDYSDSPDNPHLYLINGGITARGTDTGTLDNPRERQYFMAGNMGQGARGMYAINVGGKDLKTGNPVGIDAPQTSWLTSVPLFEASAKQDSAIGYTVGFPQIARVGSDVATSKNLATGISQAVFMGSGFAHPNVKDQETALYVYEALGKDVGTDNVGALTPPRKSGELIQKVTIGNTGGLATPAVLDVNQDGVADYAFAGD